VVETKLRPYQKQLIEDTRKALARGKRRLCIVLPCGGGKSVIAAAIAKLAISKGNNVLFMVHRIELCNQIRQTFIAFGVDLNYCEIGMVQTLTRRTGQVGLNDPDVIITDEFHHGGAMSYRSIYKAYPKAAIIGFTATPIRMSTGGLGDICDELITSVSTKWLIENGYLSPCKCYSVTLADLSKLRVKRGEYDVSQLAALLETKTVYGETVKNYRLIADGKKTIVYTVSVESARQTAKLFRGNGYTAAALDGTTPKPEREQIMQDFRDNKISILCNCELFGEGLDVPDVECVILLRKTKSLTLYIQQSMRSMRFKPDKTALIIDHVGNVFEHGFPQDDREWSLEVKKKKKDAKEEGELKGLAFKPKACPSCNVVLYQYESKCSECGYVFLVPLKEPAKTVDVDLKEITEEDLLRFKPYSHYKNCKTWDELEAFRRVKKYKQAWVIFKAAELGIDIPIKFKTLERKLRNKQNGDQGNASNG